MICFGYSNDNRKSLTRFAGQKRYRLTEIIKQNDPTANCPKMIEAKYAKILDLANSSTYRAVFRAELSHGANCITTRHVLAIKSDDDKEER